MIIFGIKEQSYGGVRKYRVSPVQRVSYVAHGGQQTELKLHQTEKGKWRSSHPNKVVPNSECK